MSWMKLQYNPGIVRDRTRYSAGGVWVDGSLVRFRNGLPEKWGGWVRTADSLQFEGVCRALHRVSDLNGFQWVGVGTNSRFYVLSDDMSYEVTPIDRSDELDEDPLETVNGSNLITVHHENHGALVGDVVVISGSTSVGGIPDSEINASHVITEYVDNDNYRITVTTSATSSIAGGGTGIEASYMFIAGTVDAITGGGWGSKSWGEEEWGGDPAVGSVDRLGIWSIDGWGEDMVACANKRGIFYWDATNPSDRLINIRDLPGADGYAPEVCDFILVSHRDRHLLAFGATEFGSGNTAPMSFRWCSQENILNWNEADTTGTAGSLPLSRGSRLVAATSTQQEIIVWSDQATYAIRYLGAPYIYGADMVADFSDIIGMKAAASFDSAVYWMGRSGFYSYTGRVEQLPCTVWDYVQGRLDYSQAQKIFACTNRAFNEIIWFYPSTEGDGEIDSYVTVDIAQAVWTIGSLTRTAWLDMDTLNNPIAAGMDGRLYAHETGADDASVDPPVPLNAFIESSPIELSSEGAFDKGDRMMFIRRILPDVTFRRFDNGINPASVDMVLKMMDKPGGSFTDETGGVVTRTQVIPVQEFTEEIHVRTRGRSMTLRIENGARGAQWRLGAPRIDVRTDGQR